MIPLIVDIQILEEHYHRIYVNPEIYHDALDSASEHIFIAHGVSKSQFETSLGYYATQTDSLFGIYEAALDTINFRINATAVQ